MKSIGGSVEQRAGRFGYVRVHHAQTLGNTRNVSAPTPDDMRFRALLQPSAGAGAHGRTVPVERPDSVGEMSSQPGGPADSAPLRGAEGGEQFFQTGPLNRRGRDRPLPAAK